MKHLSGQERSATFTDAGMSDQRHIIRHETVAFSVPLIEAESAPHMGEE